MSDPVQVVINGQSGGRFSANGGLSINSRTGAINPATSKAGLHKITYRIKSGIVMNGFSTATSIEIFPPPKQPRILFKDSVLISSSTVGNQWYNSLGPIEGDTSQNYRIDYDDEYYVIVHNDDCMSKPSATVSYIANRDGDQRNRFRLGFSAGVNAIGFFIRNYNDYQVIQTPNPGLNLNMIADYRLGKRTNIRILPGILMNRRDLYIKELSSLENDKLSMLSIFAESPIAINYHLPRVNNRRPYLIAGITPRFDLMEGETAESLRGLDAFDLFLDIGMGIDSYYNQSRITTELKVSLGTRNVFKRPTNPDDSTLFYTGINSLFSNMIILSFQF